MTRRIWILAAGALLTAVCLQTAGRQERFPLRQPLAGMPARLGGWEAVRDLRLDAATLATLRADDYLSRNYLRGQEQADLFVGYYETQSRGETIHSPLNCLPGAGWQLLSIGRTTVDVGGGRAITVNRDTIQQGIDSRLVLYWYQSHGRVVASEYWTKLYLVLDGLQLGRTDGALVRIITPIRGSEPAAERAAIDFARSLYPALAAHLPG
jgi:EpsI family protein